MGLLAENHEITLLQKIEWRATCVLGRIRGCGGVRKESEYIGGGSERRLSCAYGVNIDLRGT